MDWQPIETAPKDGSRVLLVRAGIDESAFVGSWSLWSNKDYWTPDHWVDDARNLDLIERPPTHWMPLPDPPQPTGGQEHGLSGDGKA